MPKRKHTIDTGKVNPQKNNRGPYTEVQPEKPNQKRARKMHMKRKGRDLLYDVHKKGKLYSIRCYPDDVEVIRAYYGQINAPIRHAVHRLAMAIRRRMGWWDTLGDFDILKEGEDPSESGTAFGNDPRGHRSGVQSGGTDQ